MLLIGAQYVPSRRIGYGGAVSASLTVFVADADGEWLACFDGTLSLDAIAEHESVVGGLLTSCRAMDLAMEYCGSREFWVSPAAWEEVEKYRSEKLNQLLWGN